MSAAYLLANSFTGEGINNAALYQIQYGFQGSNFKDNWSSVAATVLLLAVGFLLPYVVCKIFQRRSFVRVSSILSSVKSSYLYCMSYAFLLSAVVFNPFIINVYKLANHSGASAIFSAGTANPGVDFDKFYKSPNFNHIAQKRLNIVYIYAESLEKTYFNNTLFPHIVTNLKKLKPESIFFTDIRQMPYTGWSVAGMTATQCGIPLVIPGGLFNSLRGGVNYTKSGYDSFLPGALCLGDFLKAQGYQLIYIEGSPSHFAGIGSLYSSHGFAEVIGRKEMSKYVKDKGYVMGWGYYDDTLFDFTFKKLLSLSKEQHPFGVFLETVDTHPFQPSISKSCRQLFPKSGRTKNPMLRAVACSDYLISKFVNKIRHSSFGKDTLIVITSDHLTMNSHATHMLKSGCDHCRRNLVMLLPPSLKKGVVNKKQGSMLDVGPTILHVLGYHTPIGLGRDLLSNKPGLLSTINNFGLLVRYWAYKGVFLKFWSFPRVMSDIKVLYEKHRLLIGNRHYQYPVLITLDAKLNMRLHFGGHFTSLSVTYNKLPKGSPFIWVDRCYKIEHAKRNHNSFGSKYCLLYGKVSSRKIVSKNVLGVVTVKYSYLRKLVNRLQ